MPDERKFLLGYGERLTERIIPQPGGGGNEPAYTTEEAIARLTPMVSTTSQELTSLPDSACPDDEAVGVITLHPQWIAKSYHPQQLLMEFNLRQVGSRPVEIQPEKWSRQGEPEISPTTDIFVAGKRSSFDAWAESLTESALDLGQAAREQLRRLEVVRAPVATERLRVNEFTPGGEGQLLEVVLHASESASSNYILSAFEQYALALGARPHFERRLHAGGLCFVPVEGGDAELVELAKFAFLRVARPMPRMRELPPIERAASSPNLSPCPLPAENAVDEDLRVAVFDGGVPVDTALGRWVNPIEPHGKSTPNPDAVEHGQNVTSALLFGSLDPGKPAPRPYATVDHFRVIDEEANGDPYELYEALRRVQTAIKDRNYEFFNISFGPALSVEDDEVHPWTAILDEHLSDGHALATIAVGNNGQHQNLAEARIQVPSDTVNAMAVGAADSQRTGWKRAPYSAFGPGRSPGRIKPDVLQFGGEPREPFLVYDTSNMPYLATACGTSFASPAALRMALGVRAHFGERISPLALKALLIHGANDADMPRSEVGWGRLPQEIDDLVVCTDGTVRVVYQGEINPSQYLRALIPLPEEQLGGYVKLDVTFCYATATDPQDPGSYTRSGLDIVFRPHAKKFRGAATEPESKSFFQRSEYDNERTLRNDAHKWETVLSRSRRFLGSSLLNPVFDIHHNARTGGGVATSADRIRYALVITVRSDRTPDIYDQVVRSYAGRLETLQPRVEIPIRT
ncbi:S8 family peptidase [Saccharothrix deserti]|uniref:S8 family peptidase n=1 Tax=Saccharothrix deserti TaxID=2593674 RepID=UPI00131D3C95|nr:S8 family peptidase [Saccharothrix deserti]